MLHMCALHTSKQLLSKAKEELDNLLITKYAEALNSAVKSSVLRNHKHPIPKMAKVGNMLISINPHGVGTLNISDPEILSIHAALEEQQRIINSVVFKYNNSAYSHYSLAHLFKNFPIIQSNLESRYSWQHSYEDPSLEYLEWESKFESTVTMKSLNLLKYQIMVNT